MKERRIRIGTARIDVNYRARHICEPADILIRTKLASDSVLDVTLVLSSLYQLVPEVIRQADIACVRRLRLSRGVWRVWRFAWLWKRVAGIYTGWSWGACFSFQESQQRGVDAGDKPIPSSVAWRYSVGTTSVLQGVCFMLYPRLSKDGKPAEGRFEVPSSAIWWYGPFESRLWSMVVLIEMFCALFLALGAIWWTVRWVDISALLYLPQSRRGTP